MGNDWTGTGSYSTPAPAVPCAEADAASTPGEVLATGGTGIGCAAAPAAVAVAVAVAVGAAAERNECPLWRMFAMPTRTAAIAATSAAAPIVTQNVNRRRAVRGSLAMMGGATTMLDSSESKSGRPTPLMIGFDVATVGMSSCGNVVLFELTDDDTLSISAIWTARCESSSRASDSTHVPTSDAGATPALRSRSSAISRADA
jgi:hypothetical protein